MCKVEDIWDWRDKIEKISGEGYGLGKNKKRVVGLFWGWEVWVWKLSRWVVEGEGFLRRVLCV